MGKPLELTPRLRQIAAWVRQGAHLADVGTDHAYLPVWLTLQGRVASAIASDLRRGPLDRARETGRRYGVGDRITFRLGNGLAAVAPEECDTIVIAGMGGENIAQILAGAPWTADGRHTLLLQPQTKVELLRRWLSENGYACRDERLVWDKGKLYVVLQMAAGEAFTPEEARLYAGFCLENDPLYGDYLDAQLRRLRRRLEGLHRSREDADCGTLPELIAALEKKKEALS